jgi:hypothetical protein
VVFGAFCMASMAFRSTQNEGKWTCQGGM